MQRRAKWLILTAIPLSIAVVCVLFVVFWATGRREVPLEGIYQTGPEQMAFFVDGDCSKTPFWFVWPDQPDNDLDAKLRSVGKPMALRLKLVGHLSRVGKYGHLGGYPREVHAIKVISVNGAEPCPWPGDR